MNTAKKWKIARNIIGGIAATLAVASIATLYGVVWSVLHHEPYNNWLVTLGINVGVFVILVFGAAFCEDAMTDAERTDREHTRVKNEERRQDAADARVASFTPEELAEYQGARDQFRRDRSPVGRW